MTCQAVLFPYGHLFSSLGMQVEKQVANLVLFRIQQADFLTVKLRTVRINMGSKTVSLFLSVQESVDMQVL